MNATSTHSNPSAPPVIPLLARTGTAIGGAVVHRVRPAPVLINPTISPASPIAVVVRRSYTRPARVRITLSASGQVRQPATLTRTMTALSGNIRLFTARTGGSEITFTQSTTSIDESTRTIPPGELNGGGKVLFVQADSPSSGLSEYRLRLSLAGPTAGPPVEATIVAVALTLDISTPRTAPGATLTPLPQPPDPRPAPGTATDKWFGGLQLNSQDPGNQQQRAELRVSITPSTFNGTLVLRQVVVTGDNVGGLDTKVQLFENEFPGPSGLPPLPETPLGNNFEFPSASASSGRAFFVQGAVGSRALRDTGFQLGLKDVENDGDRVALTIRVAPVLNVDSPIVVVKLPHTNPARRRITVRASSTFGRTGTLTRVAGGPAIRVFNPAGTEILDLAAGHTLTAAELNAGLQLSVESTTRSGAANDIRFTLTLAPGAGAGAVPVGPPATISMTAVELKLDVGLIRPAPGVVPPLLSDADKVAPGRFVLARNAAFTHERAMIILRPPNPNISLTVRLESLNTQLEAFGLEEPAAGQAAHPRPATFPLIGNGFELFAEGVNPSAAPVDTGFRYGIDGVENECDRVVFTVFPDPSLPGPFAVGEHDYRLAAPFTVPATTENLSEQSHLDAPVIVTPATFPAFPVTLQALVRYPAATAGVDRPVSNAFPRYPLVILAHGNHRPLSAPGVRVENFRGLEYLARHLASYGYIAVSVDLNDMNIPIRRDPAIVQRGLTVLEHIRQWRTVFNVTDPIFTGRVDINQIALIGHSRGGETVVSAHRTNIDAAHGHLIRAVISISPTDFLGINLPPAPYLVIYGSEDGDVSIGWPFRLYDRAAPPKAMVFIYAAIHNFFQTEPDWFTPAAIDSTDARRLLEIPHQNLAKGYCLAFLDMNMRSLGGHTHLFKNNGRPSTIAAAVEIHHQVQDTARLVVDDFGPVATLNRAAALPPQLATRAATNTLGLAVNVSALSTPVALANRRTQASLQHRDIAPFWHDTVGAMAAWDAAGATYTTSVGDRNVSAFKVLSFRVAQRFDVPRNPNPAGATTPGAPQDFTVRLFDFFGRVAGIRVSTITSIPFPYKRTDPSLTKSALKTIRIPLSEFKNVTSNLDLRAIRSVQFLFDVIARGEVALDDIEFSN